MSSRFQENKMLHDESLSEAAKFEMPATDDYLAARCLLLHNIFVGLTLAHEAVEKLLKAVIVLELKVQPPRGNRGHNLRHLSKLLLEKSQKTYEFLKDRFVAELDAHYAWRYFDNIGARSKTRDTGAIHELDALWMTLFERYLDLLPNEYRDARYIHSDLFNEDLRPHVKWSQLLTKGNLSLKPKLPSWRRAWKKYMTSGVRPPTHKPKYDR